MRFELAIEQDMTVIHTLLTRRKETVATAESCTAGLIAYALTTIAGSSNYVKYGWVVYSEQAKRSELLLPMDVAIYSDRCAEHLARAAKIKSASTYGIGVTGLATPGSGEIWYGIAHPGSSGLGEVSGFRKSYKTGGKYSGDRLEIRHAAACDIIASFRRLLESIDKEFPYAINEKPIVLGSDGRCTCHLDPSIACPLGRVSDDEERCTAAELTQASVVFTLSHFSIQRRPS